MPSFAGLRGTGDWGTDERPKNFREGILWANPNGRAPLFALMSRVGEKSTDDPEFAWFEEKLTPTRVQLNTTTQATAGDNTVTLSAAGGGLNLVAGTVLQVEKTETASYDNEIVVVSSITSDTVIVLKRGQAGSTAATIPVNSYFTVIGSSYEEGSYAPDINARNPTKLRNFCQIFKTSVGITRTAAKTETRTGDPYKNDKKRKAFDHSAGIEFAMLFGKPYEDLTGSKPKRYMGGLRYYITSNVTIFTTTPTEDTLLAALYRVFDYDAGGAGEQRIVYAGNGFLNSLNKLARTATNTRINFNGTIEVYGQKLQRWILPQGEFAVKTHPLMNVHGRYTNSAFVIDPTALKWRPLRDTKFTDDVQEDRKDSKEGLWLTEAGLEVNHEETMAYIGNFVV